MWFFFLNLGHFTSHHFLLDIKLTGLKKEIILIGQKLLENNTSQHSVLNITTQDSCNSEKWDNILSYFSFAFFSPFPLEFVYLAIFCRLTAPLFPSHLSFMISQAYTTGHQALFLQMTPSELLSVHIPNPPGSPSPATVSVLMLLQWQDPENCWQLK